MEALFAFGLFQNAVQQHTGAPEYSTVSQSYLGTTTGASGLKNPCSAEQLYTAAIHYVELSFSKSVVISENVAP